jgi:hypothetical protein
MLVLDTACGRRGRTQTKPQCGYTMHCDWQGGHSAGVVQFLGKHALAARF